MCGDAWCGGGDAGGGGALCGGCEAGSGFFTTFDKFSFLGFLGLSRLISQPSWFVSVTITLMVGCTSSSGAMNLLLTGLERLMVEVALTIPNPPDLPSMGGI